MLCLDALCIAVLLKGVQSEAAVGAAVASPNFSYELADAPSHATRFITTDASVQTTA